MRTFRDLLCLFFGLVLMALVSATASAQGVIVPGPCRRCPPVPRPIPVPRALPVKSIKIDTKIAAQVATTHVEQVFRNDSDATLEGTYFFPIPESASIVEFAIWDGDRRLVGEVRSREEARRIYDEIVRRQRDPGLLEYAGRDLFQASIFPIPPHSDKKLELTYTQVLKAEGGTVNYRYPLGTGRNVSQVTGTVSGRVEVEGREPVRNIYSPSHEIDVARKGERSARVSFESAAGREPQDFQLFYTLSDADFGMTLLTHREPGKQGFFLLTISPKDNVSEQEYVAKDVVFVLDTSGSMAEAGKMEKARAALLFGVRSLRPADRFNVINFAGEEHLMTTGLLQADAQGRARGEEFIAQLRPVGGTNINGALLAAMQQFDRAAERPRLLVFMTDGLPTVGETKVERINENVRAARAPGVRLFTFGVGYDVNTALLDKLAADNGGAAEYVEPKEDLEVKVSNFFTKINHPVLTNLALDMGGVETDLVYPREMPDIFRGTQLTLIGRYRNARDLAGVVLRLTGRAGEATRSFTYNNVSFPLNTERNEFLPRLWATRRVGWLMEQIRTNGEQKELTDEIVDLGTRYGIVTPYTSYLALEDAEDRRLSGVDSSQVIRVTPGAPGERRNRAARRPATGGVGGGVGRTQESVTVFNSADAPAPLEAAKAKTGEVAVRQSKRDRAQQEATREEDGAASSVVRKVGDKTFYLRDDVWTDSEFKADAKLPETAVEFGGDAYFALIKREPQLARFFSLGERVVVVYKGRVYRVGSRQ
jgi:Ca-activated chloride channel family protein